MLLFLLFSFMLLGIRGLLVFFVLVNMKALITNLRLFSFLIQAIHFCLNTNSSDSQILVYLNQTNISMYSISFNAKYLSIFLVTCTLSVDYLEACWLFYFWIFDNYADKVFIDFWSNFNTIRGHAQRRFQLFQIN